MKNLDGVSTEFIKDEALLRLDINIFAIWYLEEGALCFTKITKDNEEMIEDGGEAETVSDSEEENKKKRALGKEKRDARVLLLAAACSSLSASAMSVPESATPSASVFTSAVSVPGLFTLLLSALLSASGVSVPVPGLSAFLSSAFPSASGMSMPVPELSAPMSISSRSCMFVPVSGLSAPPSVSDVPVPGSRLFFLPFPIWSSPQIPMPVPGRRRLGQWSGIIQRAFLEEAPTTFAPLFPSSECLSPLFFPSSGIGEKQPFNKVFNIDCRPLVDDHTGEDVNLSFAECQCPSAGAPRLKASLHG